MEREEVAKKQFNDEEEEYDEFGRKKKKSEALDPTTVTERLHLQTFLYAASWHCINQLARHFIVIKGRKCD